MFNSGYENTFKRRFIYDKDMNIIKYKYFEFYVCVFYTKTVTILILVN